MTIPVAAIPAAFVGALVVGRVVRGGGSGTSAPAPGSATAVTVKSAGATSSGAAADEAWGGFDGGGAQFPGGGAAGGILPTPIGRGYTDPGGDGSGWADQPLQGSNSGLPINITIVNPGAPGLDPTLPPALAPVPAPTPTPTPAPAPAPATNPYYRVSVSQSTPIYSSPGGARIGTVTKATWTCTRSLSGGKWWYRITGPSTSGLIGKYVPAEPWMTVTKL